MCYRYTVNKFVCSLSTISNTGTLSSKYVILCTFYKIKTARVSEYLSDLIAAMKPIYNNC